MPFVIPVAGGAAAGSAIHSPFSGRHRVSSSSSHSAADGNGLEHRPVQRQQRAPAPSVPISHSAFVQGDRYGVDTSGKVRRSPPSQKERQSEKKPYECRRVIPTPPHRQLFLVDGYGRAGALDTQGHESLLATYSMDDGCGGSPSGVYGEVARAGTSTAALSDRAGTRASAPTYMSSDTPPSATSHVQLFNSSSGVRDVQAVSPAHSPGAPFSTATAFSPDPNSSGRKHEQPDKLLAKQRFYEPVELQVESISAYAMRFTLVLWYTSLAVALVVQVIPKAQWSMVNICGADYGVDLRYMDKWTSPCVNSTPTVAPNNTLTTLATVSLRWAGANLTRQQSSMVRYRRLVLSLPPPADQASRVQEYNLVAQTRISGDGVERVSEYPFTMRCDRTKRRCDVARVPELLLGSAPKFAGEFSVTLALVPESLAAGAAGGSVGIAYQRSAYTLATIVWRYVLMFLSLIHTLRFVVYCKYTGTLYEQRWTLILQVALLWYMNPLFALNITNWPLFSTLAFMEYRTPTYFMAVFIAYMLSVMSASMMWTRPKEAQPNAGAFAKLKAFLVRSRNVCDPPMWTKLLISAYMLSIVVLDIIDACVHRYVWNSTSNSEAQFKPLYWFVVALQIAGIFVCLLLLFYLRRYLGSKPYLESRPQQLACRVFLMIFLSAIVYCVIHSLVFFLLYNRGYPALTSQQPLLQLPILLVAALFVNIMTLVYTSQNRNESVPIHPKDPRWKHVVWPDSWYRWLARHGGSQYIFATEREEMRFYRIQLEFRRRQFLAKQKRRQKGGGLLASLVSTMAGSADATPREVTQGAVPLSVQSPIHDLQSDGHRTTRSLQRSGNAVTSWRTDVWESPRPSSHVGAADMDDAADDGGSQHCSESPDVQDNDCVTVNPTRRGRRSDALVAWGARHPAVACSPPRRFDDDGSPLAATTTLGMQSSGYWGGGVDVGSNGLTPVSIAARHIINMDRFSSYFLPDDDDMTGSGEGGAAESYSGITRHKSSAGDAYAVEGPARWRSRMLQNACAARGRDGRDASIRVGRPSQCQASWTANALMRTYSGFNRRDGCTSLSQAQSELASGCQHHARSRSDGDMPLNSPGNGDTGVAMCHCNTPPRHNTPLLAQRSRYQDPSSTVGVTGSIETPVVATSRPPQAAAEGSADTLVLSQAASDRERGKDGQRQQGETGVALSACNGVFARQRDHMQCTVLQSQPPTADAAGTNDGRNVKRTPFADKDDPLALSSRSPMLAVDPSSAAPVSDAGEDNARQRSVHGETGSCPYRWHSGDHDALSNISFRTSSDSKSDRALGGTRSLLGTLTLARERLGALMGTVERNLLERPVRGLGWLEAHIFEAAHRYFQEIQYLPFFNLETAIDCFNISWEAYRVEESTDDQAIETGSKVTPKNFPRTVAHLIKQVLCGCCPAEEDTGDDAEDGSEGEAEDEDERTWEAVEQVRGGAERTAAVVSAIGGDRTEQGRHPHSTPRRRGSNVVIVHMGAGGGGGAAGGGDDGVATSQPTSTSALAARSPLGGHPVLSPPGPEVGVAVQRTAAAAPHRTEALPMNVEKYGFVRLLVAEARDVQVLMVKMDTSAPEHKGKAPRIIIGFRGTANLSNALHDVNIHRVVWREMENADRREAANAMGEAGTERANTVGDGSTTAAQHPGCASCIRSCLSRASWRPTCHAGFLTIWKTLRSTVLSRLRDILRDDRGTVYRIFTTGHSLGGALASLCAYSITYILRRMDYPITDVTVYTYGQPRMGNRTFQRLYNKAVPRTFRVVNESDIVVAVTMFGGYHVGIEVDVDRNGNFIVKPTGIEKLFLPTRGRGLRVIHHLLTNYGVSLNAIASRTPCPARGLDFYLTADPKKVEAEVKMEATPTVEL
ncbi:putative Wnt-binding factor required for Wnt secretion/Lipase (class 3) [Leishmania shawi]|uniref:Wnt-binding factor required for Wnt secretion/Lipase (Class 3) n=1 Tax=Leishmania shawi TaxID=5680 RepID=A0AAW3CAW3_9TRYP